MPALEQITNFINGQLQADQFSGMKFQHTNWNAIADSVEKTDKPGNFFPTIQDNKGESTDLSLDDTFNMQVFHTIEELIYSVDNSSDYGPAGHVMTEVASMKMVMYGDKAKLNIRPEEIVAGAIMDIPKNVPVTAFTAWNLSSCYIIVDTTNIDSFSVFASQWKGTDYRLKPSQFVVSINYRVVTNYNKSCYDICPTS